jgi:peptidoglycan biosynthesis protein MviN/MurJ (putative lipid II flippase)
VINWIQELFAELHQHVFESGVLPVLYALELGGEAERAFNATQFFLIGAIEITFLAIVLGALEKWRPVEEQPHTDWKKTDALYTMLHRLGFVPLLLFFLTHWMARYGCTTSSRRIWKIWYHGWRVHRLYRS